MKRTVAFSTLGCRLNQYETDSVVTDFIDAGYEVVPFNEPSDVYIINTCTVTARSDRKSRNLIYRAQRVGKDPLIIVTGCYVENHPDLQTTLDGVGYAIENDRKGSILPIVDAHLNGEIPAIDQLPADRFGFTPGLQGRHTRGAIKIQDGCDRRCSYCIIPAVRGRAVSRDEGSILNEISAMSDAGVLEMVLTGVNIGSYQSDEGGLGDLLHAITEQRDRAGHRYRIRISSIEPYRFTDSFYQALAHPGVCPHLHLCLQSGSDRILRDMRRGYRLADYAEIVARIRDVRSDFNMTTDIIVGFPGETDAEFSQSVEAVSTFGFSHVHVFPFSARKGTKAADMTGNLSSGELKKRVRILTDTAVKQKSVFRHSLIGTQQTVLAETELPAGGVRGFGEHYVPIRIPDATNGTNRFYPVTVAGMVDESDGNSDLYGSVS